MKSINKNKSGSSLFQRKTSSARSPQGFTLAQDDLDRVPLVIAGYCGPWAWGPMPAAPLKRAPGKLDYRSLFWRRSALIAIILFAMAGGLLCMGAVARQREPIASRDMVHPHRTAQSEAQGDLSPSADSAHR